MKKLWLIIIFIFITGCTNPIEKITIPFKYKSILSIANNELIGKIDEYTIYGKYFNLLNSLIFFDFLSLKNP